MDLKEIRRNKENWARAEDEELRRLYHGKSVMGFTLYLCRSANNKYWYAHRCKNGVKTAVYIGKDPILAAGILKRKLGVE